MVKVKTPVVRVATACSGMGTECYALDRLRVPHRLVLACEKDEHMRYFMKLAHDPEQLLKDATSPAFKAAKVGPIDLFGAGFPCQPYSMAGLGQGWEDERGRGDVIDHLIGWIDAKRPSCFFLENVVGLLKSHPETFKYILDKLKSIKSKKTGEAGKSAYNVTWKQLNSKDFGVPQEHFGSKEDDFCGVKDFGGEKTEGHSVTG